MPNDSIFRIELVSKPELKDPEGQKLLRECHAFQTTAIRSIRTLHGYLVHAPELELPQVQKMAHDTLLDPVLHQLNVNAFFGDTQSFDWYVEISYRPGVTDNVGHTATETFELWLGQTLQKRPAVYSVRGHFIQGALSEAEIHEVAKSLFYNPLIEEAVIIHRSEWEKLKAQLFEIPEVQLQDPIAVQTFDLSSAQELMKLSQERTLALSPEEAEIIVQYFQSSETQSNRQALGMATRPTDVELEVLAQTWSEHCKHKIFNATIHYTDQLSGQSQTIKSLYKTYIQASTQKIRDSLGDKDWCVSVFSDNSGVIRFNDDWHLTMKVETHNSPSALDPYGGALTGIVGVNRDAFGTGLGAMPLFNTDVFCFASPFYDQPLPPTLLHPRRVFEGVRLGVEHGGNKSGIPTVNGSLVFHERFLGKPLVFCGTGGLMPATINEHPTHEKSVQSGDLIVMVGGRIGKDGIHGATFSSEALHQNSLMSAVQIGAPIVQKRMFDFLKEARDQQLYRCITDNGAGGLSSSVGEMAEYSNGCHLELEKAPLKYAGLQPWEILVSEAQERMTLAVPPESLDAYLALSEELGVESTVIGTFNDSGFFKASYHGECVAYLEMEFLHKGLPPMILNAKWLPPSYEEPTPSSQVQFTDTLHALLGRLNICSKESVVRQYDHEVQGGSVVKPMVGVANDGPSDAAVIRPVFDSMEGWAVAHGICPKYSEIDTYHMAACAIDEAIRSIIAVGGTLEQIAGLDNFCWCDPIASEKNPRGEYKAAQLVRANQAIYDYTTLFGVPCISGKDSMKNDFRHGDLHIAVPPTLLFTAVGKVKDIRKSMTMDVKAPGDHVYVLGETRNELGASEYYDHLGFIGNQVPTVKGHEAKKLYELLEAQIAAGHVVSCHDCSDGGIAVALVESAFAGGYGMKLDVTDATQKAQLSLESYLFSETPSRFVVSVSDKNKVAFEKAFAGQTLDYLGQTTAEEKFDIAYQGNVCIQDSIYDFKQSWQAPLLKS